MPKSDTTRTQIASFETEVAQAFAGFATADSLSQAGLQRNLAAAGIKAKITATCDDLKIDVQVPEHPGVASGENAADLTDAAKERRAAAYLKTRKAAVWDAIREMVPGTLKGEQATEALRALGYSEASMPSVKTTVSAYVADGRGGYESVKFTVPGEHTKESVTETLTAAVTPNPLPVLVAGAFPGAVLPESFAPVNHVEVHSELKWPAKSEFH